MSGDHKSIAHQAKYVSLDHWRGIAALLVVVYHATAQYRNSSGQGDVIVNTAGFFWLGVQLFFVISGYCIAAAVENAFARSERPIQFYFVRRIKRIYPPYLIWLVVLSIMVLAVELSFPSLLGRDTYRVTTMSVMNWVGNTTLTETWLPRLFGYDGANVTRVGWTICYELQFYVICLLLMLLGRRWFYGGVVLFTVLLSLLFVFETQLGLRYKLTGTFLDGRWVQFAMGIGCYYILSKTGQASRICATFLFLMTALVAFMNLGDYHFGGVIDLRTKRILELGVCSVFSVLLLLMRRFDSWAASRSWLQPLAYIGLFSYSLYLVHWPVCKVAGQLAWSLGVRSVAGTILIVTPACIIISLVIGYVFFLYCERPFMNTKVHLPFLSRDTRRTHH